MSGNYQIPFQDKGLLDYVAGWEKNVVWVDNFEFAGPVKVVGMSRGRSAARFRVEMTPFILPNPMAHDVAEGIMFMTDFLEAVIKSGAIKGGYIPGVFTFVKRGQNYGVRLVENPV